MVHQYKNNGYNIELDVNSGAVHVVDDVMYDVIPMFEESTKEDIVNSLKEKKYIFLGILKLYFINKKRIKLY